jgi:hypothetical protein
MGLDVHAVNFVRYIAKKGALGSVATMGRQGLHVGSDKLQRLMGLAQKPSYGEFCEEFLRDHFGATEVESFDYSDFEGATHIADLNKPIAVPRRYDTVIDAGTMEHVFNAPQGLANVSALCADGGQIIHMLPANNMCGHGFWQFSPELFFSLYSERNGYGATEVFLADVGELGFWYRVTPPTNGKWSDATSPRALYALVRTVKTGTPSEPPDVQQSQYLHDWGSPPAPPKPSLKARMKAMLEGTPLLRPATIIKRRLSDPDVVLRRNPDLKRVTIADLL